MIKFIRQHQKLMFFVLLIIFLIIFVLVSYSLPNQKRSPIVPPNTTATPSATPTIDPVTAPAESSFEYNQALIELIKKYPWYTSLPLETKDYRVIFDFEKDKFRIRIFNSRVSPSQKQNILDSALVNMRRIGVDTNKYSYYVILGTSAPNQAP